LLGPNFFGQYDFGGRHPVLNLIPATKGEKMGQKNQKGGSVRSPCSCLGGDGVLPGKRRKTADVLIRSQERRGGEKGKKGKKTHHTRKREEKQGPPECLALIAGLEVSFLHHLKRREKKEKKW